MTREEDLCCRLKTLGIGDDRLRAYLKGGTKERLNLLTRHRRELLDDVHSSETKIAGIDTLRYELEHEK